jgi:DNA-binding transcriptional LysR family regulator
MFDLRQLECFVSVAEELHFGRAAARMHMTQPPLSRQIGLLEYDLKFQLFARTSRLVKITPAGTVFLKEARRLLALASNATSSAQRVARGEAGLLKLGFTAGSSYSFLPRLLGHTNTSLKNTDIILHEMKTRDQVEALLGHTIDVSVLRHTFTEKSIEFACVAREMMMIAVPQGHRFASGRAPTLKDLSGEPIVGFSPIDGYYFHELVERQFRNAGVLPQYVQQVGQIHSILALVGAGQGVALVPDSARALHFNRIILRKIKMAPVFAELFLAWRADNPNPALPRFLEAVLREFSIDQTKRNLTRLGLGKETGAYRHEVRM